MSALETSLLQIDGNPQRPDITVILPGISPIPGFKKAIAQRAQAIGNKVISPRDDNKFNKNPNAIAETVDFIRRTGGERLSLVGVLLGGAKAIKLIG
ncbi:MAG: hypothetical protein US86_C0007G0041 [Candidatus Daviesbacteria bacterium GW2011_GWA2_38_24]|uniref:Uncharacterized protein n=1 Tax=Candidatus Daviesbacteria bacterium GW2011_GWA2_38_24 TaxID=1618422 RepID=A0A0G0MM41_9BACT|nr:MAG: hypothetical protein US86_C0007G0041 [Candidatus Daviesbacteria bacterium GW2011_GWA2_38_24]